MTLEWVNENTKRYWLYMRRRPLASLSKGGADIVIIDDPQMPGPFLPLAKEAAPNRPAIFRNHIQIRSDMAVRI
jgi:alpha,alpha-trehalose phosphorylase (configuration-retaining)